MKKTIRWTRFIAALCMCAILCIMLTSCIGKSVNKTKSGDYTVSLQEGFYRLQVDYREGDVNGVPNISPYASERSVYSINGTIRIKVDGKTIQEKQLHELVINGSKIYSWRLTTFEVLNSGNVCFFFDGELAEFLKDRRLSTTRFVK